jgi:hypothetical protein
MSLMTLVGLQFMQQNLKVKQNQYKHTSLITLEDLNIMADV